MKLSTDRPFKDFSDTFGVKIFFAFSFGVSRSEDVELVFTRSIRTLIWPRERNFSTDRPRPSSVFSSAQARLALDPVRDDNLPMFKLLKRNLRRIQSPSTLLLDSAQSKVIVPSSSIMSGVITLTSIFLPSTYTVHSKALQPLNLEFLGRWTRIAKFSSARDSINFSIFGPFTGLPIKIEASSSAGKSYSGTESSSIVILHSILSKIAISIGRLVSAHRWRGWKDRYRRSMNESARTRDVC